MATTASNETVAIQAASTPNGEQNFQLPIDAQAVESVEAIDLDLLITSQNGEKFLLQQGALQAATNPQSKLIFKGGDSQTAAGQ